MTNSDITCEVFDAALPDYLEGSLDGSLRASVERHLRECVRCAGVVRDLENIRDEAAALPDLVPSRDLWAGIEARIAAPVIPLTARPERQRTRIPSWMGIAAAALVVSTAGVTYFLTARSLRTDRDARVVAGTAATSPATLALTTVPAESASAGVPQQTPGQSDARLAQGSTKAAGSRVPAILVRQEQGEPVRSDAVYGREIEMLQNIGKQRKTQLDSSTIAVIQKNL